MTDSNSTTAPRARRDGLVIQRLPGEVLIYDLERHKAHCLNGPAAIIWNHSDGETTVTKMAGLLEQELKRPVDEALVLYGLDQLEKARLLAGTGSPSGRMTRREAARKLGLAALIGVPLVTSIVAPTAVQAATCLSSGMACATSAQCCTGLCLTGMCA
jgi:hypothetical protein